MTTTEMLTEEQLAEDVPRLITIRITFLPILTSAKHTYRNMRRP